MMTWRLIIDDDMAVIASRIFMALLFLLISLVDLYNTSVKIISADSSQGKESFFVNKSPELFVNFSQSVAEIKLSWETLLLLNGARHSSVTTITRQSGLL